MSNYILIAVIFFSPSLVFAQGAPDSAFIYIAYSVVFVVVMAALLGHYGVDLSGKLQPWVASCSIITGLLSVFLFELSIIPIIAIASGYATLRHGGNLWAGGTGIVLGLVYLMVNYSHNYIL